MKKKMLVGIIISCVLVAVGVYYTFGSDSDSDSEEKVKYSYVNVEKGDIVIDLMADGQIDIPIQEYYFNTPGDIESINVSVGQEVIRDEVLATINTESIEKSLEEAELSLQNVILTKEKNTSAYVKNLTNYNYQLNSLKGNYEVLMSTLEDMKALSDIYSANEIEKAELDYKKAVQEYENYKVVSRPVSSEEADLIAVQKAVIAVDKLKSDLENATLEVISDGTVININAAVNESITTSKVILKVEEAGSIFVTASIQEIDILSIFVDQKAYIEIEAMLGQEFEAKVISINRDPIIDNNGIVYYDVTLELVDGTKEIMDGMTVSSTFVIMEKLDVIKIPNKAVKKVGSKQVVTVVTGENTAEEREITTGLTDGKNVEVLDGLSVGERLIYDN